MAAEGRGPSGKHGVWALDEFVVHSFQARIVAALWIHIAGRESEGFPHEDIERRLQRLPPHKRQDIVDTIRKDLLDSDPNDEKDQELQNHKRFMQMVEPFLILKYGIKYGDVGLISQALDQMCIYFHGSKSSKYAHLMLYWQYLTRSKATTDVLKRAVLANSLVNLTGKEDGFKEIDVYNEHHNSDMKTTFKYRRTSTFTSNYLFEYGSLNSLFKNIRHSVQSLFGVRINGEHTTKSAAMDLRTYAEKLQETSMRGQTIHESIKPTADLIHDGFINLWTQIDKFNGGLPSMSINDMDNVQRSHEAADLVEDLMNESDEFYHRSSESEIGNEITLEQR